MLSMGEPIMDGSLSITCLDDKIESALTRKVAWLRQLRRYRSPDEALASSSDMAQGLPARLIVKRARLQIPQNPVRNRRGKRGL